MSAEAARLYERFSEFCVRAHVRVSRPCFMPLRVTRQRFPRRTCPADSEAAAEERTGSLTRRLGRTRFCL